MPADWIYPYPTLYPGTLIKRYKRFFADIQLDDGAIGSATAEGIVTAHCPNTGPMTGVYIPGNRVLVSHNPSPKRTLAYTWELIEVTEPAPVWVGTNTALPNRVIKAALAERLFPELGNYSEIQTEVPYGEDKKSRIDFLLTCDDGSPPIYIEVKNTTWTQGNVALFPDTVTTRGQKHLRELTALVPHSRAVMLYFINRSDCAYFAPGDQADPLYGQLLREAIAQGVEILPCRFEQSATGVRYLGLAELQLAP